LFGLVLLVDEALFLELLERTLRSGALGYTVVPANALESAFTEYLDGNANSPTISQLFRFPGNTTDKTILKWRKTSLIRYTTRK